MERRGLGYQNNNSSDTDNTIYDGKDPKTLSQIMNILQNPPDLVNHSFTVSPDLRGHCIFIKTIVDKTKVEHELLRFLSEESLNNELGSTEDIINILQSRIPLSSILVTADVNGCIHSLLSGMVLISRFMHEPGVVVGCLQGGPQKRIRTLEGIDCFRTTGRVYRRHFCQLVSLAEKN
ncbi:hypothetical protein GNP92_12395 [Paenibacillus timonensis]|nr:spore germination protein [Paenibacillus timonensis]MUG87143.1 hypothetical protein [Paenibacillus timonensis]